MEVCVQDGVACSVWIATTSTRMRERGQARSYLEASLLNSLREGFNTYFPLLIVVKPTLNA